MVLPADQADLQPPSHQVRHEEELQPRRRQELHHAGLRRALAGDDQKVRPGQSKVRQQLHDRGVAVESQLKKKGQQAARHCPRLKPVRL